MELATQTLKFRQLEEQEMLQRSADFYSHIKTRRTVRNFASTPVLQEVIENAILAAGTAPNGANLQPWHFAVITSSETKRKVRIGAEIEEREFYNGRASEEWLDALSHLGTDEHKPFLEKAPVLIAIFRQARTIDMEGVERKTYYPIESTGIATGMLITALHDAGLATLTHTPSPMNFLNEILGRPKTEKPFLLLVVGYPEDNCQVPDIQKKPLEAIASFH